MDRDFFLNAGLHSSEMPSWKLMTSSPEQSHVDRFNNLESALNSMVSNPVSPNDSFAARELIGKLGSVGNGGGEVSPAAMAVSSSPYNTCYSSPINSPPPKLNWPNLDQLVKGNMPNSRFSQNFPSLAADPGFAERAAKFSCFGSRSFNGRTSQLGFNSNNNNNPDLQFRSSGSPLMGYTKLCRVSSSPALQIEGSVQENKKSTEAHMGNGSGYDNKTTSNEESSVSEQMEIGLKNPNDSNSRKRKAAPSKGKAKETATVKEEENDAKKPKRTGEDAISETEKKPKLAEPPKDYIHVRARRGQATDSHSLAERVRREKISERMKLLQDLVPGCNKVTGKALMLDEIINYVQSLQHQVEFLSMKLATVNPRQDFDINSHHSKDTNQSNVNLCRQLYTMQNPQVGSDPITVDPLPPVDEFTEAFSQFTGFEGDDLHSIVKMGFGENRNPVK